MRVVVGKGWWGALHRLPLTLFGQDLLELAPPPTEVFISLTQGQCVLLLPPTGL